MGEEESVNKQYAVARLVVKHDGLLYSQITTLYIIDAENINEAKGGAVESALAKNPGYMLVHIVADEIPGRANS